MNDLTQLLVNLTILIATVWGAVRAGLNIYKHFHLLKDLPDEIDADLGEIHRQLNAVWGKLDHLTELTDARLDRMERQLNYLAGTIRINLENLEGRHD
ncbi:hypothetical protein [Picosynechococcus sp. PCC 8807]|uniref:hypothetical protein n=1 Tax=Picosynechococcus sp. PCC 8807 TaxID=195248 RepID=UPI000810A785|nr:hypothetical protein [Picosynechococcus sp. PCC 8807]ANV90772.1 hypothetical protein AWQ24_09085 [Picosynechococcus sp. PCC 8807]